MIRLFCLVSVSLVFLSFPAFAQNKKAPEKATPQVSIDETREQAAELYRAGETSYKLQNFQESLEKFQQSYALSNEPSILFNIGQCQRQLGLLQDAKKSFEFFVKDDPTHLKRASAEKIIKALEAELAEQATKGSLKLSSWQDPTDVFIDDVYKGQSPIVLLRVEPGTHTITIKKKGFADTELTATIKPSQTVELRIPQLAPSTALLPKPYALAAATSGAISLAGLGGLVLFAVRASDIQDDGKIGDKGIEREKEIIERRMAMARVSGGVSLTFSASAIASFAIGAATQKLRKPKEEEKLDTSLISNGGQP